MFCLVQEKQLVALSLINLRAKEVPHMRIRQIECKCSGLVQVGKQIAGVAVPEIEQIIELLLAVLELLDGADTLEFGVRPKHPRL